MGQLPLFKHPTDVAKEEIHKILDSMDVDLQIAVLASMVLDKIRTLIGKFPVQNQQEIVAQLTDYFLSKWSEKNK